MCDAFERVRAMLDWQTTKPGQTWEAVGLADFACRIERVAFGEGSYFPSAWRDTSRFFAPQEGFYTLEGAKAWCADLIAGQREAAEMPRIRQ
jgi:hypothetical protein